MIQKSKFLNYIQSHRYTMSWCCIFLCFFILSSRHLSWAGALLTSSMTILPMLTIALIQKHILIPRMLHRRRAAYYFFCALCILIITIFSVRNDTYLYDIFCERGLLVFPTELLRREIDSHIYLHSKYTFLLLCTSAVVTISHLLDERKELEAKAKEMQMQNELKYLRAQINPHFLFNALNCVYALSLTNDENAPDSVLKLSEMLRYVIDDCQSEEVSISKEINYINNYIDFQRFRMEHTPDIVFEKEIENRDTQIPPMIFQPMVENCFKHSRISETPKAYIRIRLVQKGQSLYFSTSNSKAHFEKEDTERIGIGLNNVRQRLQLLFGENCTFDVHETETEYSTELTITLS